MQVQVPVAPAKIKSGKSPVLMIVVILLVVLALGGGGAAYWFFLRPAPAVPVGVLEVNATPYAEVMGVTSDKGKAVPLPSGDHWTPLRLDGVPTGRYAVQLKGPDGSTQTQQCDVAESGPVCTLELKPIDDNAMDQIIEGAK
jgi:serine/threonine-protein kinase